MEGDRPKPVPTAAPASKHREDDQPDPASHGG